MFREPGTPKSKKMLLGHKVTQGKFCWEQGNMDPCWEALKTMFNFQIKVPVYFYLIRWIQKLFDNCDKDSPFLGYMVTGKNSVFLL